jgi:phosphomannomutase / phosphoglucomutase
MSIFRAYDIRGVVGKTLTAELLEQIGIALAIQAKQQNCDSDTTFVVSRDGRLSSPYLVNFLIRGLRRGGCDVIDIGMNPSPVLYFAIHYLKTNNGVMLTGSHNPSEYNGLKIILAGNTLSGDDIQAIKKQVEKLDKLDISPVQIGNLQTTEVQTAYVQRICNDIKLKRPFKIVIDCGNGVAGVLAPLLFRALGCEVIELFCDIDGNFPNHHPDPTVVANLQTLIQTVTANAADLGLGFDGDGDRLGVVDSCGEIIWPDRQMILYAKDILSRNPQAKIVYDVKCSRHLPRCIIEFGGIPIMSRTGHSLIKTKIKQEQALLGGEMSGHIFFKERWYGFDDALYTAARLLEILAQDGREPKQIFDAIPNAISTPELKLVLEQDGEHFVLMEKILAQFKFPTAEINTLDGLRVEFAHGWGLVRPSNTTPCLVLRFEADTQTDLEHIQQEFRQQFQLLDSQLKLPF